ncbi:MAG: hypothetical protein M1582_05185 [Actinobacteria bacterium]|nr:hypothetical protein [Actinomycetota bacterium]
MKVSKLALLLVVTAASEAEKVVPAGDKTAHQALSVASAVMAALEGAL